MNARTFIKRHKPAVAGVLTALFGLTLWFLPIVEHGGVVDRDSVPGFARWIFPFAERWSLASYDSLFRFTTRPVTNLLEIGKGGLFVVFMDNASLEDAQLKRGESWDRARHATFLDRLREDGCSLVVFDVFFEKPGESNATRLLVESIKRCSNVVLTARQTHAFYQSDSTNPAIYSRHPAPLLQDFLDAVGRTNLGVGNVNTNRDGVVRQHWRYPSPGVYDSVAWTAAKLTGARLSDQPKERWVRYYQPGYAWTSLSYATAETQTNGYFQDKIVFIGNKPKNDLPNGDEDEFSTPFTDARGGAVAGVEILATEFLNLVNHEWLERPAGWIEILILAITGAALGVGLSPRRISRACWLAIGAAFITLVAGVWLTHFSKYWFPWLIVAGGQAPLAFLLAVIWRERPAAVPMSTIVIHAPTPAPHAATAPTDRPFNPPDYDLVEPPFGKGAYGKVWLARNAVGQWQALKAIYRSRFGDDDSPYEREFRGIEHYKRVSDKHPGLLRIDFVSRMKPEGFFYYAMELGDAAAPGWEQAPALYKPLDLAAVCGRFDHSRVPVRDCIRLAMKLCEPLHFLHSQGLTHRDIKPRNIIFVNGEPKLADVGLVTDAHRSPQEVTWVGTPGYMPPEPEPPGTPQADIFGLGMVLYVISTGDKPKAFPEVSTTLVDRNRNPDFSLLSAIVFKACQPDREKRFRTAEEMRTALLEAAARLSM